MISHSLCIIWQNKNQVLITEYSRPSSNKVLFPQDQTQSPSRIHTSSLLSCTQHRLFSDYTAHFLTSGFDLIVHLGMSFPFFLFHHANEVPFECHSFCKGPLIRMNSPSFTFVWHFQVDLQCVTCFMTPHIHLSLLFFAHSQKKQ